MVGLNHNITMTSVGHFSAGRVHKPLPLSTLHVLKLFQSPLARSWYLWVSELAELSVLTNCTETQPTPPHDSVLLTPLVQLAPGTATA